MCESLMIRAKEACKKLSLQQLEALQKEMKGEEDE